MRRLAQSFRLVPLSHTDTFGFTLHRSQSGHFRAVHHRYPYIPSLTGSTIVHDLAQYWYPKCRQTHAKCYQKVSLPSLVPTERGPLRGHRLLDVSCRPVRLLDRLECPEDPEYVVLSHCWGREPFLNLTKCRLSQWTKQGMSENDLPKNFRDVVATCRQHQVRYLGSTRCVLSNQVMRQIGRSTLIRWEMSICAA